MVEEKARGSGLEAIRRLRVSLVDELEGRIDSLLDSLLQQELFSRDDREEVVCLPGPRARTRKILDILECKGEEAASVFLSLRSQQQRLTQDGTRDLQQSVEYDKVRQKHKEVLRRRNESLLFYNTRHGEKTLFSEHYVNLLLLDGHQCLEIKKHEILTFGQKRLSFKQKPVVHRKISLAELFLNKTPNEKVRKVLVTGVAGIGKTVLVQKILLDFAENMMSPTFDFVIHMTFRDLNLINKPTSFRQLVLRKNRHLVKELDRILENDGELLIIFDGFDEFRHYRNCDVDALVTEVDEDAEVVEIFVSLIQGELLPSAFILLTSRPAAIDHIPVGCIDRFALIAGFSFTEVQDFFTRYFQDAGVAEQKFAVVAQNELMLTLCFIPAFCYIVCCTLKESGNLCGESPKTMTDIYVQYLVALLHSHTQAREPLQQIGGGAVQQLSEAVLRLGRLAFQKLMEHQTLFYSNDLDPSLLEDRSLISTFLDKTVAQEAGFTEEVYSFSHLTVQEFFAALYCAVVEDPLPCSLQGSSPDTQSTNGHLDLFKRFLSGILSERNFCLLSRHAGLQCNPEKVKSYREMIVRDLEILCENGAHILNVLHCLFEQQDSSLALAAQPKTLRINVSDEALSQTDYNTIKYFLNFSKGNISELDLTATGVSCGPLQDIKHLLLRCENLWLGENNLDMNAVQVIADVLQVSECLINLGIGWSNIGDRELGTLSEAIRMKRKLKELWMEGNQVSNKGLLSLSDLTPDPLIKVVAIWNNLTDTEIAGCENSLVVNFTDDDAWTEWGVWVFNRCEASSNEKLVMVLNKVCKISAKCLEITWAKAFYRRLSQLVKHRIEICTEEDMSRKLKRFESILNDEKSES